MMRFALAIVLVGPCGEAAEDEPTNSGAPTTADTGGGGADVDCQEIVQAYDADGDGWGDEATRTSHCFLWVGYVETVGDCDDIAGDVNPGATEVCGDGIDQDCDSIDPACEIDPSGPIDDIATPWLAPDPGGRAGVVLAEAGDLDGDGVQDVAIGAPEGLGAVWVLPGPVGAAQALAAPHRLYGTIDGGGFGSAIAAMEDENLDGVADLWIGSPRVDWATNPVQTGAVWHAAGPFTEDIEVGSKGLYAAGSDPLTGLGTAVISIEHFGADRGSIVAIGGGIPDADETGGIRLLTGRDAPDKPGALTLTLSADGARAEGGYALARIPDWDGDGGDELAIGAPGSTGGAGLIYVLSTTEIAGSTLSSVCQTIPGVTGGRVGTALAGGDLDGDGAGDLVIGSPALGEVWVMSPPLYAGIQLDDAWLHGSGEPGFGSAMAVGDFDGDGAVDLVVGGGDAVALYRSPAAGALPEPDRLWTGDDGSELGAALLLVDRSGDGVADLFVGAPAAGEGGAVYFLPGGW